VLGTGTAAVAANLGMLGSEPGERVGELDAQNVTDLTTPVEPVVVTVDEFVPVPVTDPTPSDDVDDDRDDDTQGAGSSGSSGTGSPGSVAVPPGPTTPPTVLSQFDDRDDDYGDDEHDDSEQHEVEVEDEHEVEDD
jgi:hypothetical protein